jgi:GNAT superfamily N-acetyltransferase
MIKSNDIVETPWDSRVFGVDTYEILKVSEDIMDKIQTVSGHFTVKVAPLFPKKTLHDYGFYYCDTLIEPYCKKENLKYYQHDQVSISWETNVEELLPISHGAFVHGRFHRDFNLARSLADQRYDNWLKDLIALKHCMALVYTGETAGFIGVNDNKLVLHALSENYKGKGLAKYFWSAACQEMVNMGHGELISSISASNISVLNLYVSMGFKFRNPCDIYHRMNR